MGLPKINSMGEGLHLMVDGLAREKLTETQVREFIHAMPTPDYLNMTIISGPEIWKNRGGWCGGCIIAESHILLHSNGIEVHADVYSCKAFDPQKVIDYCREILHLEQIRARYIGRGFGVADPELVDMAV